VLSGTSTITLPIVLVHKGEDNEFTTNYAPVSIGRADELFGNGDAVVYYKQTNSWVDNNNGNVSVEISYYDKDGVKLGMSNTGINTWEDWQKNNITSINTGYNYTDANGNWQWLGSEWNNSDGNKGWNTTSIVADTTDINKNQNTTEMIRKESGENTWKEPSGKEETNEYVRYYESGTDLNG